MNLQNQAGVTKVEILVIFVVVIVLAMVVLPFVTGYQDRQFIWVMSGSRQLQLATFNLSLEREAAGETHLAWPGEHEGSFSNWIVTLSSILSTNDIQKMLSAPGFPLRHEDIYSMNKTTLRVYSVTKKSDSGIVMISSANFTNTPSGGEPLQESSKPFGNKRFVVMRKGGDGQIYQPQFVGNTNVIGGYAPLCH